MVSREIHLAPDVIRQWSLSDLVDIVADILNQNDTEAYTMLHTEV